MNDNEIEAALSELDMLEEKPPVIEDAVEEKSPNPSLDMFKGVPMTVSLEVASAEVPLGELSVARTGDVIPLEKAVDEPLDVKVNGMPFAKAEVVMVDGKYALKFVSGEKFASALTKEDV